MESTTIRISPARPYLQPCTRSLRIGLSLLGTAPLTWIFWLCVALADLTVGFLLGFSLISKYALSKNEAALAKGQQLREKLLKIQAPLGLFAIVMGVLYLVWLYAL